MQKRKVLWRFAEPKKTKKPKKHANSTTLTVVKLRGTTYNKESEKTRFTKEELRKFELIIKEKMVQTQGLISDSLETLRNNPTPIGWGGSEAEIQESANETLTRARRLLQNLEVASGRIKNGTYGRCFGCKESHLIDPARLALAPHTTHCVPAKKKRDEISGMGPYVLLSEQVAVSA